MSQPPKNSQMEAGREIGGGSKLPVRVVHDGHIIMEAYRDGFQVPTVTTEPGVGKRHPVFYFRDSDAGVQFCVQFPSGYVQVLATEPA